MGRTFASPPATPRNARSPERPVPFRVSANYGQPHAAKPNPACSGLATLAADATVRRPSPVSLPFMRPQRALILTAILATAFSAPGQELVRNGTFDRDLSSWYGSHLGWISDDDAQNEPGSGSAQTGCSCIKLLCDPGQLRQCVPIRPGGIYRLSLHERDNQGAGSVGVQWYTSPGCTDGAIEPVVRTKIGHVEWTRWESRVSAPSNSHSVMLEMSSQGDNGWCATPLWDNVSLQVISEPPAVTKTLLIPTAANAQGLSGARFKTRLTLTSFGSARAGSIRLQVLPSVAKEGPSRSLVLSPGGTATLDDVLGDVGYEGGAAIELAYAEDEPIYVTAEVYADSPVGRYTTVVPVITEPLNDLRLVTSGIRSDSAYRTNLGCSSVVGSEYVVSAEVHAADGSNLGTLSLVVPPRGWVQTPVPFPVSNGYVVWNWTRWLGPGTPSGISCFAVVVDNKTNDGSLLR